MNQMATEKNYEEMEVKQLFKIFSEDKSNTAVRNILIEKHGIDITTETIIHSDQGCHYTSCSFIQLLKDKKLRQSMSRKGNCWDNAPQESFFGHMKDEIDLSNCKTFEEVKNIIDACYKKATEILSANEDKLHKVAGVLLEKEKITGDEFDEIFQESGN